MSFTYRAVSRQFAPIRLPKTQYLGTINSISSIHTRMRRDYSTACETMQLPPDFIPSSKQPMQQVLWIGCSDSCFQETTILDLLPDEMLVHRNLGNMLIEGDMSSELTVKHAITCLKVKHIVVCGHYGCGIVKAESRDGLNGPWLSKLDALHSQFKGTIDTLPSDERNQAFVELNVLDQLRSLRQFPEVSKAASEGNLQLHGIVYNLKSGKAQRLIEN